MIYINKIADLDIGFRLNHRFQGLSNGKNITIDNSLLVVA